MRFVELVARYKTVQVRSQNSNPQNQEVVQGTPRWRLTFARIALLAGGRVQDDADDGADCGGAQRVAGACTSSSRATSQPIKLSSSPALAQVLSRRAQLSSSSRSLRETSSRAATSRGQSGCGSAGGSGRRRRERGERKCMTVHVVCGVLCALLALCDALLTVEGGNSTLQVPSRPLPLTRGRQGHFGRYGRA